MSNELLGDMMDDEKYFEEDNDADELWLGACYIAGSVCFRMIASGGVLDSKVLISTLKAAQAEDDDRTSLGALSLQLAIEQLENRPAGS